jgi:hypothetical protein
LQRQKEVERERERERERVLKRSLLDWEDGVLARS